MAHFVYVLRCADDSLYAGYATDVEKRVAEHNGERLTPGGKWLGAKYTRGRTPVRLVYKEECTTRSEAMQREAAIKKMTRAEKNALVEKK